VGRDPGAGALKWAEGSDLRETAGRHSLKLISVPGGRRYIYFEGKLIWQIVSVSKWWVTAKKVI